MRKWIEKFLLKKLIEIRRVPKPAADKVDRALWKWKKDRPEDFEMLVVYIDYLSCLNEKQMIKLKSQADVSHYSGKIFAYSVIKKVFEQLEERVELRLKKDSIKKARYY